MQIADPLFPAKPAELSLDWGTQKSKEDALTLAASVALKRFFGSSVAVHELTTFESQKTGDFLLRFKDGRELRVECKFEDYADTWFPEVTQLVLPKHPSGRESRRIEEGWVYKSPAHLLLYVSTVTGMAVLVARKRILDIQVPMVQALLLASRHLQVPQLLNAALNPAPGGGVSRAGVGLGLLKSLVIQRYLDLYGAQSVFCLDMGPELAQLKEAYRPTSKSLTYWLANRVLSEPLQPLPGLGMVETLGDDPTNPLLGLEPQQLSTERITSEGFRFFQYATAERCASGQADLLAHVAGVYAKRPGTFSEGQAFIEVNPPVSSKEFKPGTKGQGSVHGLQRRFASDLESLLKELDREGLQERRQAYLQRVRDCAAPAVALAEAVA